MGYVNDTSMARFLPPGIFLNSAGTWTATVASNIWSINRTAADAAWVTNIPILLMSNSKALKGAYLKSVDTWFAVATAAMDSVAAVLRLLALPANAAAPTQSLVTTSYDTFHNTPSNRITIAEHKLTLTLTTPAWIDDDEHYFIEFSGDAAATSAFKFYGARASFTLRL